MVFYSVLFTIQLLRVSPSPEAVYYFSPPLSLSLSALSFTVSLCTARPLLNASSLSSLLRPIVFHFLILTLLYTNFFFFFFLFLESNQKVFSKKLVFFASSSSIFFFLLFG